MSQQTSPPKPTDGGSSASSVIATTREIDPQRKRFLADCVREFEKSLEYANKARPKCESFIAEGKRLMESEDIDGVESVIQNLRRQLTALDAVSLTDMAKLRDAYSELDPASGAAFESKATQALEPFEECKKEGRALKRWLDTQKSATALGSSGTISKDI